MYQRDHPFPDKRKFKRFNMASMMQYGHPLQCAEAKRGKFKKTPSVFLRSLSENLFLGLKFHTLISIYIFIIFFAVAILKKKMKTENF